jgi:thioredoxin-related protein
MKAMSKNVLIMIFIASIVQVKAQPKYFEGKLNEAMQEAQKAEKHIFIDCYTDWCGWCKVADEKTFANKEVAEFLSDNFIVVKMDMERGEGVYLGAKYRVFGYPSYLMFTSDGSFAGKFSGFMENNADFIAAAKRGLDASQRPDYPSKMTDQIAFPEFYLKSFTNLETGEKRKNPDVDAVNTWFAKFPDMNSEVAWSIMSKFDIGEKRENRFLENISDYMAKFGKEDVSAKVASIGYAKLQTAINSGNEDDMKPVLDLVDKYMTENTEENKAYYNIQFYESVGKWNNYIKYAQTMIDLVGFEEHLGGINEYSWTIYEKSDDMEAMKVACEWMGKVVKMDPNYAYLDTYAAVLYKSGRAEEALKVADRAIEVGKKTDENVKETEVLREKILKAEKGN